MRIHDIRITSNPLVLPKPAEVIALEERLWVEFPKGYREYVTKLGEGVLGGHFVRVYPPWRIEAELARWRQRVKRYWFWDRGRKLLPKERAVECVIIGDTLNGDELVFHPTRGCSCCRDTMATSSRPAANSSRRWSGCAVQAN